MTNLVFLSIFSILFPIFERGLCYDCDFFDNITVKVSDNGPSIWAKPRKISGCFQPDNFDVVVLGLILFIQESIPYIGDHAFQDLLNLTHITIVDCHNIKNISSHAFENLPNVSDIHISDTKIRFIPVNTFNDTPALEFLDLSDNKISEISTEAFGAKPVLEYVILKGNDISAIDHLWFQLCPKLHYVSFKHNKIQEITKRTFQFMPNLIQLLLDFNEIRFIEETSFRHLKNLKILSLVHNKLVELHPNIVPEKFSVEELDIRANFLNFLPRSLMEKLSVDVLELSGNPWDCACLDRIRDWMVETNVTSKEDDFCRTEPVPKCFRGPEPVYCSETKDLERTELFFKKLRSFEFPIHRICVNLS